MSTAPDPGAAGVPHKAVYIGEQQVEGGVHFHMADAPTTKPALQKPPRNLPPRQSDTFAGRERELRDLHACFAHEAVVGVTQQAAVHSHGGVGKTSLAIEYGWRHLDDYPGGVFFLSCERAQVPPLADLAPYLGIPTSDNAEETAAQVKTRLETGGPSLLILDNVEGQVQWRNGQWNRRLPQSPCRRLVTTRTTHLASVRMLPLDRLNSEDGLQLLVNFRGDARQESNAAAEIVEWFDGLAVGLTVVGAYMQMNPNLMWRDYANDLQTRGLTVVRATEAEVDGVMEYEGRAGSVFNDVVQALPLAERRALEYAALLPEDNVYAPWLWELLDRDNVEIPVLPGYTDAPAQHVTNSLVARQLLRPRGEDARILSLHRVLRRELIERMESGVRASMLDQLENLAENRGKASREVVTDVSIRAELTPLAAFAETLNESGRSAAAVRLVTWLAESLRLMGRYSEASLLLDRFIGTDEQYAAGAEEAAMVLGYSASILQDQGNFLEARRRMEQAIDILERQLPPNHLMLATSYSDLAGVLRDLGELPESRRRIEQSIEIWEHHLPPGDPILATSYSNLALLLKTVGDLPEAQRRMEQALVIDHKVYPSNHPTVAIHYANLSGILFAAGELQEARRRIEQAIAIDKQHFPPDHPSLALRYNTLAHIELASDNLPAASALFRRAEAILSKHFTPSHPHRQAVSNALAYLQSIVSGD